MCGECLVEDYGFVFVGEYVIFKVLVYGLSEDYFFEIVVFLYEVVDVVVMCYVGDVLLDDWVVVEDCSCIVCGCINEFYVLFVGLVIRMVVGEGREK